MTPWLAGCTRSRRHVRGSLFLQLCTYALHRQGQLLWRRMKQATMQRTCAAVCVVTLWISPWPRDNHHV